MTIGSSVVLEGVLKPDGTVEFESRPALPPGRVRVIIERLPAPTGGVERVPDSPWPDDTVPAPCDLPRPSVAQRIEPRAARERLPERLALDDAEGT
jgi:hypothetical protein